MRTALVLYGAFGDIAALCALSHRLHGEPVSLITSTKFAVFANRYGAFQPVIAHSSTHPEDTISRIQQQGIEQVIDLHTSSYSDRKYIEWLSEISGVEVKASASRINKLSKKPLQYTVLPDRRKYSQTHNLEFYVSRAERRDVPIDDLRIFPTLYDRLRSQQLRSDMAGPVAGLVSNSRYRHKEWSDDNWKALAAQLETDGITPVYLCADYELKRTQKRAESYRVIAAEEPEDYVANLLFSDVVISLDTGPKHVAAYLGRPTVGLYGHSAPEVWGTRTSNEITLRSDISCAPCNNPFGCYKGTPDCVDEITPAAVHSQTQKLLEGRMIV